MSIHALRPTVLLPGPVSRPLPPPTAGQPPALWVVRVTDHAGSAEAVASHLLDDEERTRMKGFHFDRDRDRYAVAHVALRRLLGAYLVIPPEEVALTRGACPLCAEPHGRPEVAGNPLHFSLSHSGDLALLGFAATPVGVDTEQVPAPKVVKELAGSLHPRETAELAALPYGDRPVAFARAWARKEAYLKGTGTGLAVSPAADYVGTGALPGAQPPGWKLADVPVGGTHAAAVAYRG